MRRGIVLWMSLVVLKPALPVFAETIELVTYYPASFASSSGGWTDDGTVVRLTTTTDRVGIGTVSPSTALDLNGVLNLRGIGATTTPSPSQLGQGRIYFDSTTNKFQISEDGGVYKDLVSSALGQEIVVVKSADQTKTATTTGLPTDDLELKFPVGVDETWQFEFVVFCEFSQSGGIRFQLKVPFGIHWVRGMSSIIFNDNTSSNTTIRSNVLMEGSAQEWTNQTDFPAPAFFGTNLYAKLVIQGSYSGGGDGTVVFQWVESPSSTWARVKHGSYVKAHRVQ